MKTFLIAAASFSLLGLVACGDDTVAPGVDASKPDVVVPDSSPPVDSGGNPPPPTLGKQIDRMGRPAINTAANNTFNPDAAAQGAAKDTYNADNVVGNWVMAYRAEAAKNLAIFDGLDTYPDAASGCGNQLLCGATTGDAGKAVPGAYNGLATALADDRLYTKTDATMCTTYLAVEANATGVMSNTDCGGRMLTYDVIDVTYSVVSVGTPSGPDGGPPPVGDGISADPGKTGGTTFPYLAPPL